MSYQRERYLSPEVFRRALSELSGLSISRPKIYAMLEDRKIRALRVGTHWRIDPNEIDRLPERLIQEEKGRPADYDLSGTLDSPEKIILARKEHKMPDYRVTLSLDFVEATKEEAIETFINYVKKGDFYLAVENTDTDEIEKVHVFES